jgi:chemotaxis protein methyltransferase CheR
MPESPASSASLGRFDVVLCRSVLIYFDQPTRTRVLEAIARQMAPGGLLYLGAAETVLGITDRFAAIAGERGIYRLADTAAFGGGQPVAAAAG